MNVLIIVNSFEANNFLTSCTTALTSDLYQDFNDNTVHPSTICKDDFDTIQNNPLIIDITETDISLKSQDNGNKNQDSVSNEDENEVEGPTNCTVVGDNNSQEDPFSGGLISNQACTFGTCCKICVATNALIPGQEPQSDIDSDELMNVLVTIGNREGSTFLQSCAMSEISFQRDENDNEVSAFTICRDDFNAIRDHPYIGSIVEDRDEDSNDVSNNNSTSADASYLTNAMNELEEETQEQEDEVE